MDYEVVIGLDPGETTGWCLYLSQSLEGNRLSEHWNAGFIEGDNHHQDLFEFLNQWSSQGMEIVSEAFEGHSKLVTPKTAEYIGVVKYWMQSVGKFAGARHVEQRPQVQQFWDNGKIKKLALWRPGIKHSMSATKHVLRYLVEEKDREDILMKLK